MSAQEHMTVSVIGLGQMGSRIAESLIAAGHGTTVWNRTAAKADPLVAAGATRAESVAEAVAAGDLVVVVLPDFGTVSAVLEPEAAALRGRVLVNLTSGTPDEARTLARWAAGHGAAYLDGAAMSGTRLVGRPEALFVFSGDAAVFTERQPVLRALGNAMHVGADAGLAAVYDTALFGLAWGALAGFYHAAALTGAHGVDPKTFAAVAAGHMPFVTGLMTEHAGQIAEQVFPDDDGTVEVHAAAMEHLVHTSASRGVATDVPRLFKSLLDRAAAGGHGADGIASVTTTLANTVGE